MASQIVIKHPTENNKGAANAVPQRFVAVGTATRDIVRVEGEITKGGQTTKGETIKWELRGRVGQEPLYHWMILFPAPPRIVLPNKDKILEGVAVGEYTLKVSGFDRGGATLDSDSHDFEVVSRFTEPAPAARKVSARREDPFDVVRISADYPASNQDISQEANYFVAYGPCDHDAVSARMNTIPFDSLYSNIAIEFWSAVFPPLGNNTYELIAFDSINSPLFPPVTGLIVQ